MDEAVLRSSGGCPNSICFPSLTASALCLLSAVTKRFRHSYQLFVRPRLLYSGVGGNPNATLTGRQNCTYRYGGRTMSHVAKEGLAMESGCCDYAVSELSGTRPAWT